MDDDKCIKITPSTFLMCLMSLYKDSHNKNYLFLANDAINCLGKDKLRDLILNELKETTAIDEKSEDFYNVERILLEEIYGKTFWL